MDEILDLWEAALVDSEQGLFHSAIINFEKARRILEAQRQETSSSEKLHSVSVELLRRVTNELKEHFELLDGNFFVCLGVRIGCTSNLIKRAYRAFALK